MGNTATVDERRAYDGAEVASGDSISIDDYAGGPGRGARLPARSSAARSRTNGRKTGRGQRVQQASRPGWQRSCADGGDAGVVSDRPRRPQHRPVGLSARVRCWTRPSQVPASVPTGLRQVREPGVSISRVSREHRRWSTSPSPPTESRCASSSCRTGPAGSRAAPYRPARCSGPPPSASARTQVDSSHLDVITGGYGPDVRSLDGSSPRSRPSNRCVGTPSRASRTERAAPCR